MLLEVLELVVRGVLLGVAYGLLAVPITLVFLTTDTVDLAIGGYAALGAVLASVVGGVLGVIVGVVAGVAASAVIGAVFVLLARRGRLDPIAVVLASFGLATALSSLVLWRWGKDPFVEQIFNGSWDVAGIRISPQGVVNLGIAVVLLGALSSVLYRTPLGRAMRACAVSATGAVLAGIPVRTVQFLTFLTGGGLGAVAGILIVYTSGLDYASGLHLVLVALSAAVLFGMRSPLHAFAGGIVLGVAETLAAGYLSGAVATALPMILILVVLASGRMGQLSVAGARA